MKGYLVLDKSDGLIPIDINLESFGECIVLTLDRLKIEMKKSDLKGVLNENTRGQRLAVGDRPENNGAKDGKGVDQTGSENADRGGNVHSPEL